LSAEGQSWWDGAHWVATAEILVVTDPESAIARGAETLAQLIAGSTTADKKEA
jgi:hypothetical protein